MALGFSFMKKWTIPLFSIHETPLHGKLSCNFPWFIIKKIHLYCLFCANQWITLQNNIQLIQSFEKNCFPHQSVSKTKDVVHYNDKTFLTKKKKCSISGDYCNYYSVGFLEHEFLICNWPVVIWHDFINTGLWLTELFTIYLY